MARTAQEIYNSFITIKETTPQLSGLTSSSTTALWRVFYSSISVGISVFEQIWDSFKLDLEYQKTTSQIYTESWWNDRMKNQFQYSPGDPDRGVINVNDQFQIFYPIVDESTRIIDFSATKHADANRQVTIKVAKDDGDGNPIQLDINELTAAADYVDRIKGAGLLINVVSFPADILTLELDVYFNGQYVQSTVQDNVNNAITEYLSNLEFDGKIRLLSLTDMIQSNVEGIKDIFIRSANALPDGGNVTVFDRVYFTKAGYANYDKANSIINMIIEK